MKIEKEDRLLRFENTRFTYVNVLSCMTTTVYMSVTNTRCLLLHFQQYVSFFLSFFGFSLSLFRFFVILFYILQNTFGEVHITAVIIHTNLYVHVLRPAQCTMYNSSFLVLMFVRSFVCSFDCSWFVQSINAIIEHRLRNNMFEYTRLKINIRAERVN